MLLMKNTLKIVFFPIYKLIYQPFLVFKYYRFEFFHYLDILFSTLKSPVSNSFVLFTTHKCASTEVHNILREISLNSNYKHCNFDQLFSLLPIPESFLYYIIKDKFPRDNIIYGPVKNPRTFYEIKSLKALFVLRDPRDVLVSHYYSSCFSHSLTNIKNIYRRILYFNISIDSYVNRYSKKLLLIYKKYMLLYKKNFYLENIFISYDNLFSETNLISQFIIQNNHIKHNFIRNKSNNKFSHLRSGKSGQYLSELNENTVKNLNNKFLTICNYFKFDE